MVRRSIGWGMGIALLCSLGCVDYRPVASKKSGIPAPTNSAGLSKEERAAAKEKKEPAESQVHGSKPEVKADPELESQVPNHAWMTAFKDDVPIQFVVRSKNAAEWDKLKDYWNEGTEKAIDPLTGESVERKTIKLKVPLGLTQAPPVPAENPMTLAKWELGKRLYFDKVLSSDGNVSCASCHSPAKGFTDQKPVSSGIFGKLGGVSAPTVMNSAYSPLQFWDGRAVSLEDQSQGPPQNDVEMWDGKDHAWNGVVKRIRTDKNYDFNSAFKKVFGTLPTRDAAAKAIATYERTVLSGDSVHDRAELAMRQRVADEGGTNFIVAPADYETVLKAAIAKKDAPALEAFGLDAEKDAGKVGDLAKSINNGRTLFFGKARCNSCHAGDNFTDNLFHNIGVGADKEGNIKPDASRYNALPTGHKNHEAFGAFKTPTCRGLLTTAPYLHNGSEKTLADVIEFYDRGGNVNPFLDTKMRDLDAEKAYVTLGKDKFQEQFGKKYPDVKVFNGRAIIPLKLELTAAEKKDLENFLRALNGDAIPAVVADPKVFPGGTPTASK